MSRVITKDGVGTDPALPDGHVLDAKALWQGWELPEDTPLILTLDITVDPAALSPWFDRLALIVLPFGSSADGRGFSLAERLRALGYRGRIRAKGHILADQFRAALRVGIDEVEISDAQAERMPEAHWMAARKAPDYRRQIFRAA